MTNTNAARHAYLSQVALAYSYAKSLWKDNLHLYETDEWDEQLSLASDHVTDAVESLIQARLIIAGDV